MQQSRVLHAAASLPVFTRSRPTQVKPHPGSFKDSTHPPALLPRLSPPEQFLQLLLSLLFCLLFDVASSFTLYLRLWRRSALKRHDLNIFSGFKSLLHVDFSFTKCQQAEGGLDARDPVSSLAFSWQVRSVSPHRAGRASPERGDPAPGGCARFARAWRPRPPGLRALRPGVKTPPPGAARPRPQVETPPHRAARALPARGGLAQT